MVSIAAVTEAMFYTHVDHHMHVPKVDTTKFVIKSTMPPPRTTTTTTLCPRIRSGSHTDIGPRRSNEDAHIHIDDLSNLFGDVYKWTLPSSFYAIFDGHGGSEASSYVKQHAMSLFFEDADLQHITTTTEADFQDEMFVKRVERSHCKAFLRADQALVDNNECIDEYCGTTALTVLILGRRLIIANAGDCRAVLCKKGVAVQMSQDHRPSCLQEKKRVEELGGFFEDGYLNGELGVTRALGDWHMKKSLSPNSSPLIAEPEVKQMMLSEDDEFMIIGCDGIWDVMSNQEAVALVQRQLRQHNDPQRSAKELIDQALRLHTSDNLTAIVVCFSSYNIATSSSEPKPPQRQPWRPKFRCNNAISEEARNKATI